MSVDRIVDEEPGDAGWDPSRTAGAFASSGLLGVAAADLAGARLRQRNGRELPFSPGRWHAEANPEEVEILAGVQGPVIDLACGPGRLVRHLLDCGVEALGVDAAPDAVDAALRRGAPALLADLWSPLPDEGSWETALLFDGNIGIGAEPAALLDRCAELLAPGGTLITEVGPRGCGTGPVEVRIEWGAWSSAWFPWAVVGVDELGRLGRSAGFSVVGVGGGGGRRFARLDLVDRA